MGTAHCAVPTTLESEKAMPYHQFRSEETGEDHGSFECFFLSPMEANYNRSNADHADEHTLFVTGWYWWPCFDGCLPDGEAIGPFETQSAAAQDATSV